MVTHLMMISVTNSIIDAITNTIAVVVSAHQSDQHAPFPMDGLPFVSTAIATSEHTEPKHKQHETHTAHIDIRQHLLVIIQSSHYRGGDGIPDKQGRCTSRQTARRDRKERHPLASLQ